MPCMHYRVAAYRKYAENPNKHPAVLNASALNKLELKLYHFSHRTANDQRKLFISAGSAISFTAGIYARIALKLGGVLNALKAS